MGKEQKESDSEKNELQQGENQKRVSKNSNELSERRTRSLHPVQGGGDLPSDSGASWGYYARTELPFKASGIPYPTKDEVSTGVYQAGTKSFRKYRSVVKIGKLTMYVDPCLFSKLHDKRERNIICYYSGWLQKPGFTGLWRSTTMTRTP